MACAWGLPAPAPMRPAKLRRQAPIGRAAPRYRSILAKSARRSDATAGENVEVPWKLGFQCNERFLAWDASAQRQLLRMTAAEKLDLDSAEVDRRLDLVSQILPDLTGKLERLKLDTVIDLIRDPAELAMRVVGIREALPKVNVSRVIAMKPNILTDNVQPADLASQLQSLRDQFGENIDVSQLVEQEPLFLQVDISTVMQRLKLLLPKYRDPVAVLLANPRAVLDMEELGMPTAMDMGDI